jgi:hypothetical protein
MRLPWKQDRHVSTVPDDWIDTHVWVGWEAPRNYIAGESKYGEALTSLTGPPCDDGYCTPVVVTLIREPNNAYDPNAIRAEVSLAHVGYLRRGIASQLASPLDGARIRSLRVAGLLRGGATRAPNVGCHVWLNRVIGDDGPAIQLEDDPQWCVPWPLNARDRAHLLAR